MDSNWGVRPISGPYNSSGVWGGVMGDVINRKYHLSLSMWVWNVERTDLIDFSPVLSNFYQLALTPQPPPVDTGLFIRPFTTDSWTAIFAMIGIRVYLLMEHYVNVWRKNML